MWNLGSNGFKLGANVDDNEVSPIWFDDLFICRKALHENEIRKLMEDHDINPKNSHEFFAFD